MRLLSPWGQGAYRGGADRRHCRSAPLCAITAVLTAITLPAHAQQAAIAPRPVASDFGGVGLLQMPSARMAEAGELSVHFSKVDPYTRSGLTL